MVNTAVKKGQIRVVIMVVKKEQIRVVNTVVKKGQFRGWLLLWFKRGS